MSEYKAAACQFFVSKLWLIAPIIRWLTVVDGMQLAHPFAASLAIALLLALIVLQWSRRRKLRRAADRRWRENSDLRGRDA